MVLINRRTPECVFVGAPQLQSNSAHRQETRGCVIHFIRAVNSSRIHPVHVLCPNLLQLKVTGNDSSKWKPNSKLQQQMAGVTNAFPHLIFYTSVPENIGSLWMLDVSPGLHFPFKPCCTLLPTKCQNPFCSVSLETAKARRLFCFSDEHQLWKKRSQLLSGINTQSCATRLLLCMERWLCELGFPC